MKGIFKGKSNDGNKTGDVISNLLLNYVPEGIIVSEDNGDIIYANETGRLIMENGLFGPIDIVSRNPKEFLFNDRKYKVVYDRLPAESGKKGIIATLVDMQYSEDQLKENERLKEELAKAQSFKSAFLANMSHEIRTPIHAIIGFSEIIMKQNIDKLVREQVEMVEESSYSLLAIINDVLDLSKIESGKMELVNSNYYISYIIRDIEATFSMLASRKGLRFTMHLDDNIPSNMYGDKIRLRGALLNILNNAVKYTREGHIDFYIKVREKKDDQVTLCFEVKDTGIGIRREDLNKIFESFSRFDIQNNYSIEGRGLGLSIAKGYMDLMGGKIEVESEYGVGSTFKVIVNQKIVDDTPVDMGIVNARKNKKRNSFVIDGYKALVVDDNPVNLTVANGLMKTYGLDVAKASGGKEAVSLCMNNHYDIIFMDQMMPEVDGVMAMKEIRKINEFYEKECIIIVLTADAMAGVRDRLLKEGFNEYISKPLELHRLERTLEELIPKDRIIYNPSDIVIEEKPKKVTIKEEVVEEATIKPTDNIEEIAQKLGIEVYLLKKKIDDCGGTIDDYRSICQIAVSHSKAKIARLQQSLDSKDYDRYSIEVHSLKKTLASLGNKELSDKAKDYELAVINGNTSFIDLNHEELVDSYKKYMSIIQEAVLGTPQQEN